MNKDLLTITLSDSDDDEARSSNKDASPSVGATVSITLGKPVNLSMLSPKTKTSSTSESRRFSSGPTTRKIPSAMSPAKKLRLSLQAQPHTNEKVDDGHAKLPSSSEFSLDSYCYESYDPKAAPFEMQQFNAKFQCCVGKCRMLLANNVSFMFHLWAHVTEFSDSNGFDHKREMHRFSTCPQCLHSFPTPYRMQIHYDNVHGSKQSSSVCKVCEITVDKFVHRKIHGSFDAPFHCSKCRYRTSIRAHFIDHFVRFHSNTRTLLCPFCLCHYVVPKDNRSAVICERRYSNHILRHQNEIYGCNQCSLKFLQNSDRIAHRKAHTQAYTKWVSKNVIMHTRRKGRKLWSKKEKQTCIECGEEVGNMSEHAKRIYHCPYCCYQTNCYSASQRHKFIGCKKKRKGMTRKRLLSSAVVCGRCKRTSCVENDILNHALKCSGGRCLIADLKQENCNILDQFKEQSEVNIFALRPQDARKVDDDDITLALQDLQCSRDKKSQTPSLIQANMESKSARLQYLRIVCPRPQFSLTRLLKSSSSAEE